MKGAAPKRKGSSYERELVKAAEQAGLVAKRAWGSNGQALGESEGVDAVIAGVRVQAKRRARIACWLKPPLGCDVVAVREDRGETYYVVPAQMFYSLLAKQGES